LKSFCTILLIALLFLQTFARVWSYIAFKINQNEIAATVCVQRNVAGNSCQGNCFLMKQLKKMEHEKQAPLPKAPLVAKGDVQVFLQPACISCAPVCAQLNDIYPQPCTLNFLPADFTNPVHQPPEYI
jgi:hypothetical protein